MARRIQMIGLIAAVTALGILDYANQCQFHLSTLARYLLYSGFGIGLFLFGVGSVADVPPRGG